MGDYRRAILRLVRALRADGAGRQRHWRAGDRQDKQCGQDSDLQNAIVFHVTPLLYVSRNAQTTAAPLSYFSRETNAVEAVATRKLVMNVTPFGLASAVQKANNPNIDTYYRSGRTSKSAVSVHRGRPTRKMAVFGTFRKVSGARGAVN